MSDPGREPSMEDILASIKKVIAEEKEPPAEAAAQPGEDVLELDELADGSAAPADSGPPLVSEGVARASRQSLANLQQVAATTPHPAPNPLEAVVRDMLRPVLKEWLDKNLPEIVEEHVRREISRITGTPL